MTNLIQSFNFDSNSPVRVIPDENEHPLFVASDVAKALGYKRPSDAYKQHCKGAVKHRTLQTTGGKQKLRVIFEPDVYRLIFGSKLKSAVQFQDWVFDEVLPAIRKTGQYTKPDPRAKYLSREQKGHIKAAVDELVRTSNGFTTHQAIWGKLNKNFQTNTYHDILKTDYKAVCHFLGIKPSVKLTMITNNTPVRELDDYSLVHLKNNEVWKGVAAHRWHELDKISRQLQSIAQNLMSTTANLYDPLMEPTFHFMKFDHQEIRDKIQSVIHRQNSIRPPQTMI